MKALYGLPLALGIAAVLSTAILYPGYKRQTEAAAALHYAMNVSHDPRDYRLAQCHSRTHDGWGFYVSPRTYEYMIVRPDRPVTRMIGDYSQYEEFQNIYCANG